MRACDNQTIALKLPEGFSNRSLANPERSRHSVLNDLITFPQGSSEQLALQVGSHQFWEESPSDRGRFVGPTS
jgi:hypothetical protein